MVKRQEKIGVVVSAKMEKTVVVKVDERRPHPLYEKIMKRSKKFMAHDLIGVKEGDRVKIAASRPLSHKKRWIVLEVLKHVTN